MFKINKLVIIAGLSRSGKSTLINQLKNDELKALCKRIGIEPISSYQFCYAFALKELDQEIDKLIVHYDFLSRYSNEYGFDNLQNLMENATDIKIISVCATEDILIKRSDLAVYNVLQALCKAKNKTPYEEHILPLVHEIKNRITILTVYKEAGNISRLYENWFAFFKPYHSYQHWLLDAKNPEQAIECPEEIDDIWAFINHTAEPSSDNTSI